jgi:HPt (histidine-containing phosphotransfer) domain-containing protein
MRSSASIDPAALERLRARATADAPEFYDEMLAMFLGEIDKRLAAIMESLSHGELEVVARAAHSLGGSAKLFGAYRLGELCGRLQAPPPSLDDARAIASEVARECQSVRLALSDDRSV